MKVQVKVDSAHRGRDGFATVRFGAPRLKLQWQLDLTFRPLYDQCGLPDPLEGLKAQS